MSTVRRPASNASHRSASTALRCGFYVRDGAVGGVESTGGGLASIEWNEPRADVYLSRPEKRNAMTVQLVQDLTAAFRTVSDADDARAVTLLGEGPVFRAGMDLEMMRERTDPDSDVERDVFPDLLAAVESMRQPVVAGIKRAAPAGTFELTLPCDFRVLGREAKYGVIEVKLGTFPHGGATQRLPRLVGLSRAGELVLTGEFVDPEEVRDCGLVHEIRDDGAVDGRARVLADRLCANAPLGLRNAKRALDAAMETPLEAGLELERSLGRELNDTHDYREGFDARLEDREPEFRGE
jgi:enoyl-CoA hydratase/carnithine racemase